MGDEFDKLIIQIREVFARGYSQRDLADFLSRGLQRDVPQPRISEWLNCVREPGAETTLLMLKWVAVTKRKQKAPAVRQHNRSRKTQSHRSKHEKRRSGPKSKPT